MGSQLKPSKKEESPDSKASYKAASAGNRAEHGANFFLTSVGSVVLFMESEERYQIRSQSISRRQEAKGV